jgi:hypothetical protein
MTIAAYSLTSEALAKLFLALELKIRFLKKIA